jgi:hypothetical protein
MQACCNRSKRHGTYMSTRGEPLLDKKLCVDAISENVFINYIPKHLQRILWRDNPTIPVRWNFCMKLSEIINVTAYFNGSRRSTSPCEVCEVFSSQNMTGWNSLKRVVCQPAEVYCDEFQLLNFTYVTYAGKIGKSHIYSGDYWI